MIGALLERQAFGLFLPPPSDLIQIAGFEYFHPCHKRIKINLKFY